MVRVIVFIQVTFITHMHDVCQIHGKSYYLILNYIFKNEFYNSLKYVYDLYIIWKAFVDVET